MARDCSYSGRMNNRLVVCFSMIALHASAQSIGLPWTGHGHNAQHTGLSRVASQPLSRIKWQTPVDLAPQYSGSVLYAHYGSPVITRQNTVIVPVKTGATDGYKIEARDANGGSLKWTLNTGYSLPSHGWVPLVGIALTPKNRIYTPDAGGTVSYRDAPDDANGATGQIAFYGLANYQADPSTFDQNVKINTPITTDRYGNIYFGFIVTGSTTPALQSGIARIGEDGVGTWVSASAAASDGSIGKVAHNCAPALSNDHRTLYIAVNSGGFSGGYLLALDARSLATQHKVRLKDAHFVSNDAYVPDDGSAAPTVGPDGDVYYGVLENSFSSNHLRGWLLHFDSTLTATKTPGAFGWDDTAAIVPASCVPSYTGASKYLLMTKYNHYVEGGGDGVNKIALIDPSDSQLDPISNTTVMKEIMTKAGPTRDDKGPAYPNAVSEWCINTVAIDPFTKSCIANCEDGKVYRWDFTTNTLTEAITITWGLGEAYTPTMIGPDGTVYAIGNATLYAIGQ